MQMKAIKPFEIYEYLTIQQSARRNIQGDLNLYEVLHLKKKIESSIKITRTKVSSRKPVSFCGVMLFGERQSRERNTNNFISFYYPASLPYHILFLTFTSIFVYHSLPPPLLRNHCVFPILLLLQSSFNIFLRPDFERTSANT